MRWGRLALDSVRGCCATAIVGAAVPFVDKRSMCDEFPLSHRSLSPQQQPQPQPQPASQPQPRPVPVETRDAEYVKGIKLWSIGIKEDPLRGSKRGKGLQQLTSSYFIYDLGVFINREFLAMQTMAAYAEVKTRGNPLYDFHYFANCSNALFLKAEAEGLQTKDGRDFFLMACWLAMAAAEVDGFGYSKYSREQRAQHRAAFYAKYTEPEIIWVPDEADDPEVERKLGKYAIECPRIDLIPTVALERLGLHNELCALKWEEPSKWMSEGFDVKSRFASMKRHYESVHAREDSEDHLAHLIWGFMALTHVIAVFPHLNNLPNFEAKRRENLRRAEPGVAELVGDGGFRAAGLRQSLTRDTLKLGQDGSELFRTYSAPEEKAWKEFPEARPLELKGRRLVHRDGDWHRAVEVWIVDGRGNALLQRRSKHKDTHPDMLDVACAGHITADATPAETALTELSEELGCRASAALLEPHLRHAFVSTNVTKGETKHGAFMDREILDVYLLRWDAELARLFYDGNDALDPALFKIGMDEVAGLCLQNSEEVLKALADGDDSFVPRPAHYLTALREHLIPNNPPDNQ